MEFDVHVTLKDRKEVFRGLQMHPSSRSYAPRVVASRSRLIRLEDLREEVETLRGPAALSFVRADDPDGVAGHLKVG